MESEDSSPSLSFPVMDKRIKGAIKKKHKKAPEEESSSPSVLIMAMGKDSVVFKG
tara:strand:+ start:958 stop:1122 length:165 start_codon:yes stop_codon:yes gene_type:complete